MKTGYSNLMGELVEAVDVGGMDCIEFQITCPICHEPIYKSGENARQFLSHYGAARALVTDCENRVKSFTQEGIAKSNSASRDQKLEYFLRVVPDEIDKIMPKEVVEAARMMRARKAVSVDFAENARLRFQAYERRTGRLLVDLVDENLPLIERIYPLDVAGSPLARRLRVNSAKDVLKTLLSHTARPAWSRVFTMAVTGVYIDFLRMKTEGDRHDQAHVSVIIEILDIAIKGRRQEWKRLARFDAKQKFDDGGPTFLQDIQNLIIDGVIGMLLRLDYFRILADRQANRAKDGAVPDSAMIQ
jgi:hypothetical protein